VEPCLGDLYPESHRVYVSTLVGLASSAGIAGGQLLAGMVGPTLGWRAPFLIVAIPAICCACLIAFTVNEPKRGSQEKAVRMLRSNPHHPLDASSESAAAVRVSSADTHYRTERASLQLPDEVLHVSFPGPVEDDLVQYSEKVECKKVLKMFSTYSVALIFIQGFPGCLPWGMIYVFLNDYFSEDRHVSIQTATSIMTCFSCGGLLGQLSGGWFGQYLYNIQPCYQCLMMGITTMLAVGPMLYLLNASDVASGGFFTVALLGGFMVNMNGPNVRVVLQVS
jgi:predicted MFS family arabinose efflux permease